MRLQKYVKGKPCKPYNSTLGEFFRVSKDVGEPQNMTETGLVQLGNRRHSTASACERAKLSGLHKPQVSQARKGILSDRTDIASSPGLRIFCGLPREGHHCSWL